MSEKKIYQIKSRPKPELIEVLETLSTKNDVDLETPYPWADNLLYGTEEDAKKSCEYRFERYEQETRDYSEKYRHVHKMINNFYEEAPAEVYLEHLTPQQVFEMPELEDQFQSPHWREDLQLEQTFENMGGLEANIGQLVDWDRNTRVRRVIKLRHWDRGYHVTLSTLEFDGKPYGVLLADSDAYTTSYLVNLAVRSEAVAYLSTLILNQSEEVETLGPDEPMVGSRRWIDPFKTKAREINTGV